MRHEERKMRHKERQCLTCSSSRFLCSATCRAIRAIVSPCQAVERNGKLSVQPLSALSALRSLRSLLPALRSLSLSSPLSSLSLSSLRSPCCPLSAIPLSPLSRSPRSPRSPALPSVQPPGQTIGFGRGGRQAAQAAGCQRTCFAGFALVAVGFDCPPFGRDGSAGATPPPPPLPPGDQPWPSPALRRAGTMLLEDGTMAPCARYLSALMAAAVLRIAQGSWRSRRLEGSSMAGRCCSGS